jgi:beta-lactamase class A
MKYRRIVPSLATALLLTSASGQQPPATPLARLQANIERITKSVNADWGIYIKCLETGEEIALNADKQMDTMSVIKIPLMVEAFRQIEAGKFSLVDKVTLKESDKRPRTGIIRSLDPGAVLTIKDLLTLMIIVSDNTATDLMFDKVGGIEPVNQLAQTLGLKNTRATGTADVWFKAIGAAPSAVQFHTEGKTPFGLSSPRDMGKLLELMERGQAVSKKSSDLMLQMMRGQVYSSRLPKYLAGSGFRVPHKTGDFLPYIGNDVGILESPNHKVVVSVFTAHHYGAGAYLEDAIGRVAEQVANYFGYR